MPMRIVSALSTLAAILIAMGCSMSSVWSGPSSGGGSGTAPSQAPRPSAPQAVRGDRFLGHLAVKGMHNEQRNLMTSIVVHPKLWETTPYILFDENGFGKAYDHDGPMSIDTNALRAEARHDAESAAAFWGNRRAHALLNTEGWSIQWDASLTSSRKGVGKNTYNRKAFEVYTAILEGVERGWPSLERIGWWDQIVTPEHLTRRKTTRSADAINREAAPVWRRVSYFAGHIYPFKKLVPDSQRPGVDEAHAREWVRPVHESVTSMLRLRDSIGGDQLILPCMFGTSRGWRGKFKNQWMTENERRLLVRASFEAGADGIMVWQPIRSERERDEFQRAVVQIEAELALINGDPDLGPSVSLGEMFGIQRDWPGRPMDWMRRAGDQTLQPLQTR